MEAGPDSLPAAVQDMQPAPVPALRGRTALSLALALVASEYLIGTIKLSVHEAGHGWAVMLAGGVYRRMYLSPTLVGYTWWWLPPESLPLEKWITAAGLVGGIGIGLLFMLAAWLARRREGWLPVFLALGGLMMIGSDSAYWLMSPSMQWGDGYDLLNLGVRRRYVYGLPLLLLALFVPVGVALTYRALRRYAPLRGVRDVGVLLLLMMLPGTVYALVKAWLFHPDLYRNQLSSIPVVIGIVAGAALLGGLLLRVFRPAQPAELTALPARTTAFLVLTVLAVEIFCALHFGLRR